MIRLVPALLFIACGALAAHASCLGRIAGASSPGNLSYNPFAAQDTVQTILVTIENRAAQPCSYQLSIPAASYPLQIGGKLSFVITPAGTPGAASTASLTLVTAQVPAGQAVKVPLSLTIFRGQSTFSGVLTAAVTLALSLPGASPSQRPLDQVQLPLSCSIPPVFEINIAGSGQHTSIDFGELTSNRRAAVVLQTRATANYSLRFHSTHAGYLWREGSPQNKGTQIPYSLTVDGEPVSLSEPSFLQFKAQAGETSHRFIFTIGEASNKAAGLYRDVITVRIASFL